MFMNLALIPVNIKFINSNLQKMTAFDLDLQIVLIFLLIYNVYDCARNLITNWRMDEYCKNINKVAGNFTPEDYEKLCKSINLKNKSDI